MQASTLARRLNQNGCPSPLALHSGVSMIAGQQKCSDPLDDGVDGITPYSAFTDTSPNTLMKTIGPVESDD